MSRRTILCFGDSNTHGTRALRHWGDRRRFDPGIPWPDRMAATLGDGFHVISEGHPGRTAVYDDPVEGEYKNGLRVLPALLESHFPIDLVIVMLGTNDTKARFAGSAVDIAGGIERLVVTILKSGLGPRGQPPKVLIAAPVPVTESGVLAEIFAGSPQKAQALPAHLEALAKRWNCGFIDLAPVAEVDPADGVHLTPEGHAAIAVAMTDAAKAML